MNNSLNLFTICFLLFFSVYANESFLKTREILEISGTTAFCYLNANGTVYNLNPLHKDDSDYEITQGLDKVYLNFCGDSTVSCEGKYGMITYQKGDICYELSGNETVVSDFLVLSKLDLIIR
jgi:hypothetical protein